MVGSIPELNFQNNYTEATFETDDISLSGSYIIAYATITLIDPTAADPATADSYPFDTNDIKFTMVCNLN